MKPSQPFFSIIIPTLNEEQFLPVLLEDLSRQTFTDFEVIHVDGNSEDKTKTVAKSFAKKIQIKTYAVKKRNVSYQRNFGVKKATGEWVIFMDADNQLAPYFLEGIKYRIVREKDFDLFTNWVSAEMDSPMYHAICNTINLALEVYQNINRPAAFGALIGAKRQVATQIQFDEKQRVFEDGKFVQESIKKGYVFKIMRDPKFVLSMRRFRKEGTLRMVGKSAILQLQYLQNKSFEKNDFGYLMEGGGYYNYTDPTILSSLQKYLTKASKKQLAQVKKIYNSIIDWEI